MMKHIGRQEEGAALVLAILSLAILTVIGLALVYVTGTELKLAASDGHIGKAFHSADAGIQWAAVEMVSIGPFLGRAEFAAGGAGFTEFRLSDHSPRENPAAPNLVVRVTRPRLLGRHAFPGGSLNSGQAEYEYDYAVTSQSRDDVLHASRSVEADIEVGPLPETAPGA